MLGKLQAIKKREDWSSDPDVIEELKSYEKYISEEKEKIFREIVLNSIGCLKIEQPIVNCCKKIDLSTFPNYNKKTIGNLLGKYGHYKQLFEQLTGVDLNIDRGGENTIVLSKYNCAAVNKACNLIKKLLEAGEWNQEKMERLWKEVLTEWKEEAIKTGQDILENFLNYRKDEYSEHLARYTGELKYIYSFSQNILEHSMEVAQIASDVANQIGLDSLLAKRAGFFHDIGKAIANFDDHILKGLSIARGSNLPQEILDAIADHHKRYNDIPKSKPYSIIVKLADSLSGGRNGARPRQMELIEARKKMIKNKIQELSWVKDVVIGNVGNFIHIFLKLEDFKYENIEAMKTEVRATLLEIRKEYSYNFEIKFELIYKENFFLEE